MVEKMFLESKSLFFNSIKKDESIDELVKFIDDNIPEKKNLRIRDMINKRNLKESFDLEDEINHILNESINNNKYSKLSDYVNIEEFKRDLKISSKKILKKVLDLRLDRDGLTHLSNEITLETANLTSKYIVDSFSNFKNDIETSNFINEYDVERSLVICFQILTVNSIMNSILSVLITPVIGTIVTVTIIAPITEEIAKQYSIQNNFDKTFMLVFNIFETALYLGRGKKLGIKMARMLMIRTLPIIMHYTTYAVQKLILSKMKKPGSTEASVISTLCGIFIHSLYNSTLFVVDILNSVKK